MVPGGIEVNSFKFAQYWKQNWRRSLVSVRNVVRNDVSVIAGHILERVSTDYGNRV